MSNGYNTTTFLMDSGERYCLIIDQSTDLPVYYPNLFITTQIRNRSDSFSTMMSAAGNLIVLLRFLDSRNIDIKERVLSKQFLKTNELDDLRDFTQQKFARNTRESNISSFSRQKQADTVNSVTHYMRLTTCAQYLSWYARILLDSLSATESKHIDTIESQIKSRRPVKRNRNQDKDKSLDDIQVEALFEVIRIGSSYNPFDEQIQRRNRLIIIMLYYLGLRGGELLNLRISDINFSSNQVRVVRRADDKDDPRIQEPNVKTLERTLPIAATLAKELHDYITQDRRKVRNAKKNNFLFITHKAGPTVGQPISKSGYHKIINVVKGLSPQLYALTGHRLRHTWNRKFSEEMDLMDSSPNEARQEQLRSYLMGWKQGSGTAAHYNKRFTQNQAQKAALALQESIGVELPKDLQHSE